jgi:methyltransferase (TIGR00027 family)
VLTGVPRTALGVARIRAGESRRPDRLFDDPYAAAFVAAMPDAFAGDVPRSGRGREVGARIALHVVVRTKFYDDYLLAASHDGVRQVALLAAGLDTRSFRLPWPAGTTVFEVDLPETVAFKEEVLAQADARPTCERRVVTADLTGDWPTAMSAAGFDPQQPTAWLVEGLLVYLSHDDAARLLETAGALSGEGSRLSCEQGRSAMQLAAQSAEHGASEATKLWQGGIEDIPTWLGEHGWSVELRGLGELARDYGRPVAAETTTTGFVIGRR